MRYQTNQTPPYFLLRPRTRRHVPPPDHRWRLSPLRLPSPPLPPHPLRPCAILSCPCLVHPPPPSSPCGTSCPSPLSFRRNASISTCHARARVLVGVIVLWCVCGCVCLGVYVCARACVCVCVVITEVQPTRACAWVCVCGCVFAVPRPREVGITLQSQPHASGCVLYYTTWTVEALADLLTWQNPIYNRALVMGLLGAFMASPLPRPQS